MVSVERTQVLLEEITGLKISEGTIMAMIHQCARQLAKPVEEIRQAVMREPIIHVDETGVHLGGKLH